MEWLHCSMDVARSATKTPLHSKMNGSPPLILPVIQLMRVWALCDRSRKVLILLLLLFLCEATAMAVIMGLQTAILFGACLHLIDIQELPIIYKLLYIIFGFAYIPVTTEPLPGVAACAAVNFKSSFFSFWIPIVAFQTILVIPAICLVFRTILGTKNWDFSMIFKVLLRDNILHFLVYVLHLGIVPTYSGSPCWHFNELLCSFCRVTTFALIALIWWTTQPVSLGIMFCLFVFLFFIPHEWCL